jgi:hydrogenase maturation protein HypF
MSTMAPEVERRRLRLSIQGAVQGVGFRPFVYRLATELDLTGWVVNDTTGVFIEVEGPSAVLAHFLARLPAELPPRAFVHSLESEWLEPAGYDRFEIRHSHNLGAKTALVLPDLATCPDCLAEVLAPTDRRFRYPFTNCTNCGPRFSIIRALPYDRPHTTMAGFTMCPDCRREYEDPRDRRFHAQPNACPVCGPRLWFGERQSGDGHEAAGGSLVPLGAGDDALRAAVEALRRGLIVAVKGLGGFHLMADATNAEAVARLRARKRRGDKPFALMVRDLTMARRLCQVSPTAAALLGAVEAPIVLLPRAAETADRPSPVAEAVAPGNPNLGLMLPYTPLHHLLLRELDRPVVATSGNRSDEPICTDNDEALTRLADLADAFLLHDRPIARHVDDSVAWIVDDTPRLLRRARGYAPLPVRLAAAVPTILAVGGHLKNTVALSVGRQVFISQHIGDLETAEAMAAFERVIADFLRLYEAEPVAVAHDLHPAYASTRYACEEAKFPLETVPRIPVQHHHAHLAACLAEHGVTGTVLGVTWDGTGYGPDGTVWGGEFLLGDARDYTRVAHLRPFRLPGGDAAVHEPRRVALALLWELYGEAAWAWEDLAPVAACPPAERRVLARMVAGGFRAPWTTSMGRLFDGVAALIGLHQRVSYEGQAAMRLEFVTDPAEKGTYPLALMPAPAASGWVLDWGPLIEAVIADVRRGIPAGIVAGRFHNALVDALVRVAQAVGHPRVALTGGCFQNRLLTERALAALRAAGFDVLLHRQVPPNDGGISLGQIVVAAARLRHGN